MLVEEEDGEGGGRGDSCAVDHDAAHIRLRGGRVDLREILFRNKTHWRIGMKRNNEVIDALCTRAQTPHRCPPCPGSGYATYWMLAGISWEASCGPLGGVFEASWGPFWCLLGPLLGLLGASWGLLGASWGLLGASWAPLGVTWGRRGAEGSNFRFGLPLLGTSWGRLGALLGASWAVLAPSGPSWGPLGSLLGRSWGPLGPSSTP